MLSRRSLLALLASSAVAACNTAGPSQKTVDMMSDPDLASWYVGYAKDGEYDLPLVDRSKIPPEFHRQTVSYDGPEKPGTIVVDIDKRFLYLVQPGGQAVRYGVGVGKLGFSWRGQAYVGRKGVWPGWSPTKTMDKLHPDLPRSRAGGVDNPLGARALYLYQGGRDILFRLHGTNEPWSIGEQVSSGCVRMLNEDVIDLYNRVPVGATVLVKRNGHYRV